MGFKSLFFCIGFILFSQMAKSQIYLDGDKYRIGLKAGPLISTITGNALTKSTPVNGFTGGLYYKYKLNNGFHFQTEICPSIRNTKFNNTSDTGYTKFSFFYMDFAQ